MVQVLPQRETVGSAIAEALGTVGSAYFERKNRDDLIKEYTDPNTPPERKAQIEMRLPTQQLMALGKLRELQAKQQRQQQQDTTYNKIMSEIQGGMQQQPIQQQDLLPAELTGNFNQQMMVPLDEGEMPQQRVSSEQMPSQLTEQKIPGQNAPYPQSVINSLLSIDTPQARAQASSMSKFNEDITKKQIADEERLQKEGLALRKETLPVRQEYATRGEVANQAIENKERLMEIVERNSTAETDAEKIDDPMFAQLAQYLPLKLGERLLSPSTAEYRAGLFGEFGALRTMFQGATRIEEIKQLENKLAGLWLTDEQKKRVLRSGIEALQSEVIKSDVAADIEKDMPNLGPAEFQREVTRRAKPRIQEQLNKFLEENKQIVKEVEERNKAFKNFFGKKFNQDSVDDRIKAKELSRFIEYKNKTLDENSPQGQEVIASIYKFANNNPKKAEQIANRLKIKFEQ